MFQDSWKTLPISQQPVYEDHSLLEKVLDDLKSFPPLVDYKEIETLKALLANVFRNELFLLQAGDCVERFDQAEFSHLTKKVHILLEMAAIISQGLGKKVVIVGRIGGQYAKPRSANTERIGDKEVPVFRGEIINGYKPNFLERRSDPKRLLEGYKHSSYTFKHLTALLSNNLTSNEKEIVSSQLKQLLNRFMHREFSDPPYIFSSHEGLLLNYESALSRLTEKGYYNLSTHLPWIGHRTRSYNEAHVAYFREIQNPIGIKIGPPFQAQEICKTIQILNPKNEEGKIILISRLGVENVEFLLPPLIQEIKKNNFRIIWCCDPMHGNSLIDQDGIKIRHLDTISNELQLTIKTLNDHDEQLGGLHCEVAGNHVAECLGGYSIEQKKNLSEAYQSYCDPRLNYFQSLEITQLLVQFMKSC